MPTNDMLSYKNLSAKPSATGPLKGKSFLLPPNISVRNWPAQAGSKALEKFVALDDATTVDRLQKAGGHLVGYTRMNELGFGLAADQMAKALTSSLAEAALMIDMMGEARVTACRARLCAFKPTSGIVSRFGLIGLAPSLESVSVLAQNFEEIALIMSVIAGKDERDFSMDEGEIPNFQMSKEVTAVKTAGVIKECLELLDEGEKALFAQGLAKLKMAGFSIEEFSLPNFHLSGPVHQCVGSVEASSSCGKFDGVRYGHRCFQAKNWNEMYLKSRGESFDILLKAYLFQGAYFQFQNYDVFEKAGRIRARLIKDINILLDKCATLALPTLRRRFAEKPAAGSIAEIYEEFCLTLPANLLGMPVVSMPAIASDEKTDLGIQLLGKRLDDIRLLAAARQLSSLPKGENNK